LEKLYTEWEKALKKPRYKVFVPALTAGLVKFDEYYQRAGISNAHIMAMVLNPSSKMGYLKKHNLFSEVEDVVLTCFLQRYDNLHEHAATTSTRICKPSTSNKSGQEFGRMNIDDTDSESDEDGDPGRPWLNEWATYLNSNEVIPEGMGMVQWWGIHGQRYPTWRSLARDYLAIMASSVSCESTFSATGITTSKRRDRVKGDIVEALQCLRSSVHQDLSFHDVINAAQEEEQLDMADQEPANREASSSDVVRDGEGWSLD
jgi:hypothetical protein